MRYAIALACVLALGACSEHTEILLTISSVGLRIGTDISSLQIEAQPAADQPVAGSWYFSKTIPLCSTPGQPDCRPQEFVDSDYKGSLTMPINLLILPGNSSFDGDVRVWVNGYNAAGTEVIAAGDRFPFAKGKRLYLDIPLFAQCLGNLSCQVQDEACSSDLNCVAIPPTTTPTPSDMGGPADASTSADLSVACGTTGHNCCDTAPACDSGNTCGSTGICFSNTTNCGQVGQGCCVGDVEACNGGAVCTGGTCAVSCSGGGSASCTAGQTCAGNVCVVCGGSGDICCDNSTCTNTALTYCDSTNHCSPCGTGDGVTCCTGTKPCGGSSSLTCNSFNTCVTCGAPGEACCGTAQTCLNTPDGGMPATCSGTLCTVCDGHEMGPCCPGGPGSSQSGSLPLGPVIDVPLSRTPNSSEQPDNAC